MKFEPRGTMIDKKNWSQKSRDTVPLKVDGNEKLGGPKGRQQLNFSPALWRSRVILNLNVYFICKIHYFRFRLLQLFE